MPNNQPITNHRASLPRVAFLCYNTINSTKQDYDMITLKIENKEVENIFLEGFDSNKEAFLSFIKDSYNKMALLNSLDRSVKQVKLQQNGELNETTLDELIDELENHTNS